MKRNFTFKKSNKAVALIFFTLIFAVFLGFFAMVMNSGDLVLKKIRLQSAVDLAAYSGASIQASYLGNLSSGEQSIRNINGKIQERYFKLLDDLQVINSAPWPQGIPNIGACVAACVVANYVNGEEVIRLYKNAQNDIFKYHDQIRAILQQMPAKVREAVEATIAINIPDLSLEPQAGSSSINVTNQAQDVINRNLDFGSNDDEKENAVLTFSSDQGMYLTNVVSSVPHSFPYFGPACFNLCDDPSKCRLYYCTVNGKGGPVNGIRGYSAASLAYALGLSGGPSSGNIGMVKRIADPDAKAIQLHFVEDPTKPAPFVTVAAEWYPDVGVQYDQSQTENKIFPTKTRLVAVSSAEPFGSELSSNFNIPFGVRLQGIRRLLLDPRMQEVKDDYGDLFPYMQSLSPKDENGDAKLTAEQVIRKFLH